MHLRRTLSTSLAALVVSAGLASAMGTGAFLEDCNAETQAEIRVLKDEYSDLQNVLRKAVARSEGQQLRKMGLSQEARDALPQPPEKPDLSLDRFHDSGTPLFFCGEDGTAPDSIEKAGANLDEAKAAVAAYEAEVTAQEQVLIAAEDGVNAAAAPDTDVAVLPDAGSDIPPVAADPDATPPADDPDTAEGAEGQDQAPAVASKTPMPDPDNENLFRRVISLPNATLRPEVSDTADGTPLPTFSVLYVFSESQANGENWLEVGASLREDATGWVKQEEALAWSSMLVMNFAPRGSRSDVLFFKDATTLTDLVSSAFFATDAGKIYEQLKVEREALQENGEGYAANWPSELVAVEPETAVTFEGQPYLLPILDWREEAFDGVTDTVLLQVAAVPSDASDIGATDQESFESSASLEAARADGVFRVGVTFVLDTTISMRPFIDRTYETVEGFFNAFQQFETAQNVSFGLVGFRDNIDRDPAGLEYAARVFSPLDTEADPRTVLATARQMRESSVPTVGFEEDGFLGVHAALEQMDWEPFDSRLIVMVTDASSREGNDPLAGLSDTTAERLAEMARLNNAAIFVIHLRTPANESSGDYPIAQEQYQRLTATGDTFTEKYLSFDGASDEEFREGLSKTATAIANAVITAASGELIMDPNALEPVPESAPDKLVRAVQTEIFRAQLESLAAQGGGDAPSFLEGWAADRDLTDPSRQSLDVGVFLTRNQLSSLDKQLDGIVRAFRSGGDDPKAFFANLQVLATEMSTDPDQPIPEGRDVVRTILPDFLDNLPYRSQVLQLDEEYWLSLGVANQQEFIENLESKRSIYRDLDDDTSIWVNFGANDPGLEATPVSLRNLP